jgi:hypothetical protein
MVLDSLKLLLTITCALAIVCWTAALIETHDALYAIGAALGILLSIQLSDRVAFRFPIASLLLWLCAGGCLSFIIISTDLKMLDLGVFSPLALWLCWGSVIPLFIQRMSICEQPRQS